MGLDTTAGIATAGVAILTIILLIVAFIAHTIGNERLYRQATKYAVIFIATGITIILFIYFLKERLMINSIQTPQ